MRDYNCLPGSVSLVTLTASKHVALCLVRRGAAASILMAAAVLLPPVVPNAQGAAPTAQTPTVQSSATMRIVKGRVLVQPKAGLSTAQLDRILAGHGGKRKQHLTAINVHVVELPATANEMAVIKALKSNPNIKFAEPDGVLDPSLFVN